MNNPNDNVRTLNAVAQAFNEIARTFNPNGTGEDLLNCIRLASNKFDVSPTLVHGQLAVLGAKKLKEMIG